MATVTVKVNDDAPDDLAVNGQALAAGAEAEIDPAHLAPLADYVTVVEPEAPEPKAAAKKTAPKKASR